MVCYNSFFLSDLYVHVHVQHTPGNYYVLPQCKHLLATFLARKLSLCVERPTDLDRLSDLYNSHFTLAPETEITTDS